MILDIQALDIKVTSKLQFHSWPCCLWSYSSIERS